MDGRIGSRALVAFLAALLAVPVAAPAAVRAAEPATVTLSSPTGEVAPGMAHVTWGEPFTLVATIDPDGPVGPELVIDGTVTFTGAATGPVTVPVVNGTAETSWTLPESAHFTATYQGGSTYEAPPSLGYELGLLPVPVTVGYTVVPSAPAFDEPVSLEVTVDPAVPTASKWTRSDIGVGGISVYRLPPSGGAVKVGEYVIDNGETTVALDLPAGVPMPAGANDIRVEFTGDLIPDFRFAPGEVTGVLAVAQAPATVQLSGPTTVAAGALPTYVVSVGPAAAAYPPTGIVRLFDGPPATGTEIGAWLLGPGDAGTASIDLASPLAAGGHDLYATFDGATPAAEDPNRLDGTSSPLAITVGTGTQEPLVVVAPSSAVYGTEHPLSTSGGSGDGAVTYDVGGSTACAVVAGPALRITAGAGSCSITATKAADADHEAATSPAAIVAVQPAVLTVAGITASPRTYDGTTAVALSTVGAALVGVVGSDDVTLMTAGATGTLSDRHAGAAKAVAVAGLALGGADAGSYTLVQPTTVADIARRPITVTAVATTKEYDGTTTSSGVPTITSGALAAGDTATWAQAFGSKAVGSRKTLTPTGTVADGNGGGNYAITFAAVDSGVITPKALTVKGVTAADKTFDGTTTATIDAAGASVIGVLSGDAVTLLTAGAVGTFASKEVGSGKTVTVAGLAIAGPDAASYTLTQPTTTASITKAPVEVLLTDAPATWETNVPVTFTVEVRPRATDLATSVSGTVELRVDGVRAATAALADGRATFTTKLALGTRTVVALFTPDAAAAGILLPGTSAPLARNVVANGVSALGVGLGSTSVYPVKDGWRDTVAIRGTRNERISVAIAVYSPTGTRVRTASIAAGTGPYGYSWNGRSSSGSILAAGKYRVVQVLRDGYGASRSYTSYVTLSRRKMTWYTKTITVAAGPRRFSAPGDPSIQSQFSTTSTRALTLSNPIPGQPKWLAVGYQFTLPSASTYTSLSFQVQGSWTGTTAPKVALVPWSGGSWSAAMYSTTRARAAMDTIATDWDAHTLTNLTGIRSGRYVRAVIDSFDPAKGSGYAAGPYRYTITGVRLVVKYGILN